MFRKTKRNQTTLRKKTTNEQDSPESLDSSKASCSEEEKDNKVLTIAQKRKQLRQKNMIQTVII